MLRRARVPGLMTARSRSIVSVRAGGTPQLYDPAGRAGPGVARWCPGRAQWPVRPLLDAAVARPAGGTAPLVAGVEGVAEDDVDPAAQRRQAVEPRPAAGAEHVTGTIGGAGTHARSRQARRVDGEVAAAPACPRGRCRALPVSQHAERASPRRVGGESGPAGSGRCRAGTGRAVRGTSPSWSARAPGAGRDARAAARRDADVVARRRSRARRRDARQAPCTRGCHRPRTIEAEAASAAAGSGPRAVGRRRPRTA